MSNSIDGQTAEIIKTLTEGQTRSVKFNGIDFLIHPTGISANPVATKFLPTPPRVSRSVTLADLGELQNYLNELLVTSGAIYPVIFATYEELKFTLYPNFHRGTDLSWLDHVASVRLVHSREFKAWQQKDGVRMSQVEFAEFIDKNVIDITEPTGASMLTMAQTLESTRTEVFKSAVRVSSGTHKFTWANDTADGSGNTEVPERFKLALRVFQGDEEAVEITAKLYYRIKDGALTFFFQLHRVDEIVEKLWTEKLVRLREDLQDKAEVFAGSFNNSVIV
jgi:uncharacterized protein YfdQ (DUF2303 family)